MIGLGMNVLVRYMMQDDAKQSALVTRLVECERTMTFDRGAVKGCGMTPVC